MSSSLRETLVRLWDGFRHGSLDEHRTRKLILGALYIAVVGTILLVAADPVIRHFASMTEMRKASALLRDHILEAWRSRGLLRSALAYLAFDALVVAPALAVLALALLRHWSRRLDDDGGAPIFLDPGRLLLWAAPLAYFVVREAGDAFALAALWFGKVPDWLHVAIRVDYVAERAIGVGVVALGAWLFASWYFLAGDDSADANDDARAPAQRAAFRSAVADIVWRSKYAIAIVAVFGALVLGMDQTRDAVLRQVVAATERGDWKGVLVTLAGIVVTLLALTLLARACWLWPRLLLRLRVPGSRGGSSADAETFAKWLCRLLGVLPFVFVAAMIANLFHDIGPDDGMTRWLALALGVTLVQGTVFLVRVSNRVRKHRYYAQATSYAEARSGIGMVPLLVGWGAPLVFVLARASPLVSTMPPLVLVVVASALATWAGLLGWVARQSRRDGVPWVLLAVGWVGVAAYFDLTDADRVRSLAFGASAEPVDLRMMGLVVLAIVAIAAAVATWWRRPDSTPRARGLSLAVAAVAIVGLLMWREAAILGSPTQRDLLATRAADSRPTLDEAVADWIKDLPSDAWKARGERHADNAYPVFIVTSEGGGIRSAYWTLNVLATMRSEIPDFERRTFALSGVSGGALGVGAYHACSAASRSGDDMTSCVANFGEVDLWTQLLGGLFFEDAIATLIPTWKCRLPGCGVLGRSYWFEGAMERAVPGMTAGLSMLGRDTPGAPHLFLNATRAESGERVLQSDIRTTPDDFPGSTDVIAAMQSDLRLSTAAHNSARFPFTNPVGAVYVPAIPRRGDGESTRDPSAAGCTIADHQPVAGQVVDPARRRLCMRLQDGGYFDNSSASTANDLLRALAVRLAAYRCPAGQAATPADCDARIAWVKPVIIEIRNGIAHSRSVVAPPLRTCAAASDADPGIPADVPPLMLFPSALTAIITTFQTRVAHMRDHEAETERAAALAWTALGMSAPQQSDAPCMHAVTGWLGRAPVQRFDLGDDGVLYPQGWILSSRAREGIVRQARCAIHGASVPPYC